MLRYSSRPERAVIQCKYCLDAIIYYDDLKGRWCEVDTNELHRCSKRDYSQYVSVQREDSEPCTFCHRRECDRAVIFFQQPGGKPGQRINTRTVICDACTQKVFRALVGADVEVAEH